MKRLPIRARLTVVFVAVMGLVLLIIGSFLYYRTKRNLDESIAQSLQARQGAARAYVESAAVGQRTRIPPGERFAQVLSPSGRVLASRPEGRRPVLSGAQVRSAAVSAHRFQRQDRARYLAGPGLVHGQRVVVVVGASLAEREKALEGLAGALVVGGPLALLLAAVIAYATTAGALGPVEEMRRRAATITRADTSTLLPVPAVDDELRRLSLTLNEMLGRIGRAAEGERRFIANASHELRTPLAALQAELEIAHQHPATAVQLREAIGRSRQDVARLIHLSNGLLDLAAIEEAAPASGQPIAVDELLRAVAGDLHHHAVERQRELVVRPCGLSIVADESGLRRALANLVENALVHGAGAVSIGAEKSASSQAVELWVRDHGTVDPALDGGRAFERFARGPDAARRPGAGLGLALVQAVAVAHGGHAELLNEPTGGVRAAMHLPLDAGHTRSDAGP